MPTPVKLLASSTDTQYESRMSWTFQANLADLPAEAFNSPAFGDVPLRGKWSLKMNTHEGEVKLHCRYGELPKGVLGPEVAVNVCLEVMCEGSAKEVVSHSWDPEPAPALDPGTAKPYTSHSLMVDLAQIAKQRPWFESLANHSQTYRLTACLRRCASSLHAGQSSLPMIMRASLLAGGPKGKVARQGRADAD